MTDSSGLMQADPLLLSYIVSADQNPALVYLASLSSHHSRRTMHTALNSIAAMLTGGVYDDQKKGWVGGRCDAVTLPWAALRFQHTAAIRARLDEIYAPATANKMLSALRRVLEIACNLGQMTADECRAACNIKAVKGEALPAGRELTGGEIKALVDVCRADTGPVGARDAALIGVLYTCGLRRAEIVALDAADFDKETGRLAIQNGKGRKARAVYVAGGALSAMRAWLVWRGEEPGPLFSRIRKGNKLTGERLATQAVYSILKKRANEAGVSDFSPHDLRRTFVGDMLSRGADIALVARIAGHASVTTTARYDRRPEEAKRAAASLLHYPFEAT